MVSSVAVHPRLKALGAALVLLIAFVPYANSFGNGFVWDDNLQLAFEPPEAIDWGELLTRPSWMQMKGGNVERAVEIKTYRPLLLLSFYLDAEVWGHDAFGWHLTNWLLFAAFCLCIYAIALDLSGSVGLAVALSAIYATQGILTESVSWVSGRHDILMSLCLGLAGVAVLRGSHCQARERQMMWVGLALVAFVMALGSKEPAALFPIPLAAALWTSPLRDRWSARTRVSVIAGFVAVAAAYGAFRAHVVAGGNLVGGQEGVTALIQVAPLAALKYLGYFFYRPHLTSHYLQPLMRGFGLATFILPMLCHIGLLGLAWWQRKRWPSVFPGLVLFYAFLAPALVVVTHKPEYSYRFLFLPSLGLVVALVGSLWQFLRGRFTVVRWLPASVVALAVVAQSVQVYQRNIDYRDDGTFYASIIRDVPESAFGYVGVGDWAQRTGDVQLSRRAYATAIEVAPQYHKTYNNLAVLFMSQGKLSEAERVLQDGLAVKPDYAKLYLNLGEVQAARGQVAAAEENFKAAISHDPAYVKAYRNLYRLYQMTDPAQAEAFRAQHLDFL